MPTSSAATTRLQPTSYLLTYLLTYFAATRLQPARVLGSKEPRRSTGGGSGSTEDAGSKSGPRTEPSSSAAPPSNVCRCDQWLSGTELSNVTPWAKAWLDATCGDSLKLTERLATCGGSLKLTERLGGIPGEGRDSGSCDGQERQDTSGGGPLPAGGEDWLTAGCCGDLWESSAAARAMAAALRAAVLNDAARANAGTSASDSSSGFLCASSAAARAIAAADLAPDSAVFHAATMLSSGSNVCPVATEAHERQRVRAPPAAAPSNGGDAIFAKPTWREY